MGDRQRCPCCTTCEECPYFQNVVNVKSAGLLIYRYFCAQGVNIYTGKNESSTEIFILQNTKNYDIASEKLIPKLGQYKKCPRCKYILEHAEKILHNIPTVNKLDVLGICDKCRTKDRKGISSCECSEVIKKFIAIKKSSKKEATKTIKRQSNASRQIYVRPRSESLDNIICHINSKQKREPQVNQLTVGKKELHETNLIELQQKRISFPKIGQKIRLTPKNYSDSELTESDADIHRFGSNVKFKKPLYSDEKINWPVHDAKLFQSYATDKEYPRRRISISEESLFFNFHDLIEKSDHQPQPKLDSLRPSTHIQKEIKLKDNEPSILDLIAEQNRRRNEFVEQNAHEFETTRKSDVGTGSLKTKMGTMLSPDTLPKYSSDKAFSSSLLAKTKELLQKDFSYFFINEAELIKKPVQVHKSSSELIKDTQDMLLAREEDLKRKNEEELVRRLNEDDKKRKASERKIILLEESKTVFQEDIQEKKREKNVLEKLDTSRKKTISIGRVSKDVKETSEKSVKSGTKAEPKSDKNAVVNSKKAQNKEARQVKELSLKLEKEHKLREKKNLKREKEDQSKKEIRERVKNQSAREKEKKEPSEKGKKEKPVTDKETRIQVKEKQFEKESKTREQEKNEIDKIEKQKYSKQIEDKSAKEQKNTKEIEDKSAKEQKNTKEIEDKSEKEKDIAEISKIEKRKDEEKVIEKKTFSADMSKAKEDAALKLKAFREMEHKTESVQKQPKPVQKSEEPKIKELNINEVKIRGPPHDDLILQLVKLKQSEVAEKRHRARNISEIHIPLTLIADHKRDHKGIKMATCAICNDSELELDIEEITINKAERVEINNIIIGQKIFKYKKSFIEKSDEKKTFPIFMTFNEDLISVPKINIDDISEQLERKPPAAAGKYAEQDQPKGIIRYALSDRTFIEKGWTMLPTEKVVRKMNVYRMRPAHPEFDWFEHNKNKKIMHYDTGEKLAEFDDSGRGRLYYRSGRLALDYYDAEEINAQQRFVIHSSGEPDTRGCSRPLAILATFDYLGNGIVFDHTGKIRLKYNQTEGVILDRSIGPVSHWKWHTLNDPPVLQQVMIDTQMAHKDPDIIKLGGPAESKTRPDNEEMLAIEFDNFIKEKSKKLSQKFKPFQIKMKALKINEHFSLRVLDQATIYLIFRDGSTNLKINLGMILDHQEIIDTDTAEVGEVSNSLERFPARTDSLAALQKSVAFAQRVERSRVERERRLRPTQPCSSSDKTTLVSRPLRAPLRAVASEGTVATCNCRCRKLPSNNLYYDTRLV